MRWDQTLPVLRGVGITLAVVVASQALLGLSYDRQILAIGALTGLVYAVLAAGLVLVFRATKVINFAHVDVGAVCSLVFAELVLDRGWPYLGALAVAIPLGAATGFLIDVAVVRRLSGRPRLVLLVATIGVSQLLTFIAIVTADIENPSIFPSPITSQVTVAGIVLRGDALLALAVMPAIILGLGVLLNATPYGIAIRASSENGDAARLAGMSIKRISTLVWTLTGAIAAISVIAAAPLRGDVAGIATAVTSPSLLLRALAAGLVGRFSSLPLTLAGGIGVGIIEALVRVRYGVGEGNAVLALMVVALVLLRGRELVSDSAAFALSSKAGRIPDALAASPWARRLPRLATTTALAAGIALPLVITSSSSVQTFSRMLVYAIAGLSVTVLAGWSGQLSLGQFGFVGVGAATTTALTQRGVPYGPAVGYAVVGTVVLAMIVGAPALRVRGLFLAVTTIAFAVAADSYVIPQILRGSSVATLPRPQLGPVNFADQRSFYYLCLIVLIGSAAAISALRRSGIGRSLIAVRDNEAAASAFSVSPARVKLIAFGVSGGLAALAGGLLAALSVQVSVDAFTPAESLRLVAMVIIGGLGSVPGAILGAAWVIGVPEIFGNSQEVRVLSSAPALLILLMYLPGGVMQVVERARVALLGYLANRDDTAQPRPAADVPSEHPRLAPPAREAREPGVAPLRVVDVHVSFGGLTAVDGVDLEVRDDEIVGLIGSNGAGKSTLMNAISGLAPARGEVWVDGGRIDHLPPAERARQGVGRSFQDARLFADLTVHESIRVALEVREASELVPSMFALPPSRRAERSKVAVADDLIALLGLGRYARSPISELSTGTRRITDLACLLGLRPSVVLLDEPTAGIAQREAEAFGPLLKRIRAELDASVLIIEHDIPLIMSVSDRVYCMGSGRVIATGLPEEVRSDPAVIASYLGTDDRSIKRSDLASSAPSRRRRAPLRAGAGGP